MLVGLRKTLVGLNSILVGLEPYRAYRKRRPCSRGQLALDMGPHLASGAMVFKGAQLTLDLEPLAVWAHCILIWSPFLLHGVGCFKK